MIACFPVCIFTHYLRSIILLDSYRPLCSRKIGTVPIVLSLNGFRILILQLRFYFNRLQFPSSLLLPPSKNLLSSVHFWAILLSTNRSSVSNLWNFFFRVQGTYIYSIYIYIYSWNAKHSKIMFVCRKLKIYECMYVLHYCTYFLTFDINNVNSTARLKFSQFFSASQLRRTEGYSRGSKV